MFLVRQMLRRCLRLLEEDSEPGLILSLLVSTAVLERSLGDVGTAFNWTDCYTGLHLIELQITESAI